MNRQQGQLRTSNDVQGFDYTDPTTGQFIGTFPNVVAVPSHEVPANGGPTPWKWVNAAQWTNSQNNDPNAWHPILH